MHHGPDIIQMAPVVTFVVVAPEGAHADAALATRCRALGSSTVAGREPDGRIPTVSVL